MDKLQGTLIAFPGLQWFVSGSGGETRSRTLILLYPDCLALKQGARNHGSWEQFLSPRLSYIAC